ncbi:hypothetical protein [Candidatus Tokpelaia sp.]|uniref:hypothetical protein n=1 Tax=Candidatus Tokpelaia sp. TaxID=2233777 RepID=UPI001238E581|nr:hypothetical protein [Candidatus Tokpelaia sp.]KAA6405665.1 hypothetical protein DPQ22_03115 [Candidatus Tokpelaia sp.]
MQDFAQTRLNKLREAVKGAIKEALPQLQSVDSQFGKLGLDEMKMLMVRPPAVRVAILAANFTHELDARLEADVNIGAFIVTEGKGRDELAWGITEAVCCLCRSNQLWGLIQLSAPRSIRSSPLLSAVDGQKGFSISGVEWSQKLWGFGESLFNETGQAIFHIEKQTETDESVK